MVSRADILKKSRQAKQRRRLRRYILALAVILVVFGLTVYLVHLPALRLERVVVVGADKTESDLVKQATEKFLFTDGWIWWPRDNRWFYEQTKLITTLQKSFPQLQIIKLDRYGGELTIHFAAYQASLVWCQLAVDQSKDCYFLNDQGKVLARAPIFSDPVFFEIQQKTKIASNTSDLIGQIIIPKNEIDSLLLFRQTINNLFDQTVLARSIINQVAIEDYGYSFVVDSPANEKSHAWRLLVMFGENPARLQEVLAAVLVSAGFKDRVTGRVTDLEYIDARLPGKVFYKLSDSYAPPSS